MRAVLVRKEINDNWLDKYHNVQKKWSKVQKASLAKRRQAGEQENPWSLPGLVAQHMLCVVLRNLALH